MDNLTVKYEDFTTRIKIGEQMVIQGFFIIGDTLNEAKKVIPHGEFTNYIVELGYKPETARQYMQVAREIPSDLRQNNDGVIVLTSFRKCLKLASAPYGVKEDVANSKDKEEAEKKIKDYERQLKEEREAKEALIKSNEQLQQQLENEKKKEPKVNTVYQDREVKPADYDFIKSRLEKLEGENKVLSFTKETLSQELDRIRNDIDEKEEQLRQYEELNRKLNELGIGMDIREQYLEDTTELAQLVGSMEYFFDEKLAPTKYKRCLKYYKSDSSVVKSLRDIVEKMEDWLIEIKSYLPESNVIIDNSDIIDVNHTEVE